jgi:hypothetical protein
MIRRAALATPFACGLFALCAAVHAGCGGPGELDLLPLGADAGDATASGEASDGPTDAAATDAGDGASADGSGCMNGPCPCGLSPCSGACYDLANDPQHCGTCTQGCNHGAYCHAGTCACLPGLTLCPNGTCDDTSSNPDTCGGCTTACTTGQSCELGCHSAAGSCPNQLTACPASNGRVQCVNLDASVPFCGTCGVVCGPDQVCAAKTCQTYAPATPCTACPCPCDALVGAPSSCCPGVAGGSQVICVQGSSCP